MDDSSTSISRKCGDKVDFRSIDERKFRFEKNSEREKMSAPEAKKAKLEQDDHAGLDQNKPMTHRPNIILAI